MTTVKYDSWDNYDEDGYPAGEDHEVEYWEDWEEEDDPYEHQYSPVQGNWDPEDFDDDDNVGGFRKTSHKIHSVKMVYENNSIKKKQQQKIRKEAKAREKQRQKYYHYQNNDEEE